MDACVAERYHRYSCRRSLPDATAPVVLGAPALRTVLPDSFYRSGLRCKADFGEFSGSENLEMPENQVILGRK